MTKRQYLALVFIRKFIETNGWSPSYEEIAEGIHLHSKSGVNRIVYALRERGFIEFTSSRARSIELVTGKGKG